MIFEWSDDKNNSNFSKHGIWFEEAQTILADQYSLEFFYSEHSSHQENRFIRIGHTSNSKLLLVVFCEKNLDDTVRIISARKTTNNERKQYEKGI